MPFVNIKITREDHTTASQKSEVIRGVTKVLEDVLHKPPSLTFIVIDEVELEDWGFQGISVEEHRRRSVAEQGQGNPGGST